MTPACERIDGVSQDRIHLVLDGTEEDVDAGAADVWADLCFLPGLLRQPLLLSFLLSLQPLLLVLLLLLLCLFSCLLHLLFICLFFCYPLLLLQSNVVRLLQNRG